MTQEHFMDWSEGQSYNGHCITFKHGSAWADVACSRCGCTDALDDTRLHSSCPGGNVSGRHPEKSDDPAWLRLARRLFT